MCQGLLFIYRLTVIALAFLQLLLAMRIRSEHLELWRLKWPLHLLLLECRKTYIDRVWHNVHTVAFEMFHVLLKQIPLVIRAWLLISHQWWLTCALLTHDSVAESWLIIVGACLWSGRYHLVLIAPKMIVLMIVYRSLNWGSVRKLETDLAYGDLDRDIVPACSFIRHKVLHRAVFLESVHTSLVNSFLVPQI